jgi:hypothetical protein
MLNMQQSPLVIGWGQNAINASFPIHSKRLQIVYPSSGNVSRANPFRPNSNVEFRQLLDKNSAVSLHGSYFQVTYTVGRIGNWLPGPPPTGAAGAQMGSGSSETSMQPLDAMDRIMLYTHFNPCRLIQNATLWLGSTNVETVNNIPLVTDAKFAFYSHDAICSTMSDCYVNPVDGSRINGTPLIHPFQLQGSGNAFKLWHDSSIAIYQSYSIHPKNNNTNALSTVGGTTGDGTQYGPSQAQGPIIVEPQEYFLRNANYAVPVGTEYSELTSSRWNTIAIPFTMESAAVDSPDCTVSYFNYGNNIASSNVPITAGGNVSLPPQYDQPSVPPATLTIGWVTRRIPLSALFGFCEQNVLVPSNLIQLNLVRANDDQFITNLFYPETSEGTLCPTRTYAVCVANLYLVLKYFDLNQTAADLLSQDQLLTVNHYSVYSNQITAGATGTGNGSLSLQSYAGLKSILVRISPSWAAVGQSTCVSQTGGINIIYRGKMSPLQQQAWNIVLNPPNIGTSINTYQGGPMLAADPSTYFEEYSSWNGDCWNGVSATISPSVGYNFPTWCKSQFTLAFNFVENQSQNADTVAAPIQVNYNLSGANLYNIDSATPGGIQKIPTALAANAKNTIQVVFLRTNILKYLGSSRQFCFVTNGSS